VSSRGESLRASDAAVEGRDTNAAQARGSRRPYPLRAASGDPISLGHRPPGYGIGLV